MDRSLRLAWAFWADEDAATMLEYALVIGFVAIACVAAGTSLGKSLLPSFQNATGALS